LVPARHLEGPPTFLVFDAASVAWRRHDPTLPAFLNDAPAELAAAQAFWSRDSVRFVAPAEGTAAIVYYHTDAVGSVAALTAADGALLEERSHYPFGALRHVHRPGTAPGGTDFDFTGHPRDRESGLVHMGARSYLDVAGVFLGPDPRFASVAALGAGTERDRQSFRAFLLNPQMGHVYAHAMRQPLKYVDPDGLEPTAVVFSKSLTNDPEFKHAWRAFAATREGQKRLQAIEWLGGKVYLTAGKVARGKGLINREFGRTAKSDVNAEGRMAVVTIDLAEHRRRAGSTGPGATLNNIARDIHRQLRVASLSFRRDEVGIYAQSDLAAAADPHAGEAAQNESLENATHWILKSIEAAGKLQNPGQDPANLQFETELTAEARPK
jgi:RHS repeat-associated protein